MDHEIAVSVHSNTYTGGISNMIIYHKHHIVPRHMGGTDDPSNLINLTIEEHAEAHRMLYEEHGKWEDKIAWQMLSGQISNAEAANEVRRLANLGKRLSEETKRKISSRKTNPPKETRKRMSIAKTGNKNRLGKKHTDETKEELRKASMGNKNGCISGYKLDDTFKEKKRKYMSDPNNNPSKRPEVKEKLRQAALLREQKKREQKSPL